VDFVFSLSGLRIPIETGNLSRLENVQAVLQSPYPLCYLGSWWNDPEKPTGVLYWRIR
jgi:hypothetical protein